MVMFENNIVEPICMDDYTKGYISAAIDYESCVSIRKNKVRGDTRYIATYALSNTERELIEPIYSIFGGSLTLQTPKNPNHSPIYMLYIHGKQVHVMLVTIHSYIKSIRKSKLANCIIEFCRMYGGNKIVRTAHEYDYCEGMYLLCKKLNARGNRNKDMVDDMVQIHNPPVNTQQEE